jgi:hypothetical protein
MNYKALQEAESLVSQSLEIPEEKKRQIADKLEQARSPLESDKWIYRIVVGALGVAILSCLVFSFLLMWHHVGSNANGDVTIPEIFLAIGSAAVGALAGLLAPSPGSRSQS